MKKKKMILYFILVADLFVMAISLRFIWKGILQRRSKDLSLRGKTFSQKRMVNTKEENKIKKPSPKIERNRKNFNSVYRELILNDFDNGSLLINNLGKNTGVFSGIRGICEQSLSDKSFSKEYSLKLNYDVSSNDAYAGFWSALGEVDLRPYRYLSFWIKRLEGNESFKIELSDGLNNVRISIREFLSKRKDTSWLRVIITLDSSFKGITNWKNMKGNFTIIFEYSEGSPYKSAVYIDEISFVTREQK